MRIWAVAVKEFWGLIRQTQLLLLLLVGPVLIMAVFGLSLNLSTILAPRVAVVVEPGSQGADLFERFRDQFEFRTSYLETVEDPETARGMVRSAEVDAMFEFASKTSQRIAEGKPALLGVTYKSINPVFGTAVPEQSYSLVSDLNLEIV